MEIWRIHHKPETISTNLDARQGKHGDVYTAGFQISGRGRLDHKWQSPPDTNLMMSVVLSVDGLPAEQVVTLPLVVGISVCEGLSKVSPMLKWPNDVLVEGKKLAGILCERHGDDVIVGIGINVLQDSFPIDIAARATSLKLLTGAGEIVDVRDAVLRHLGENYREWHDNGFGGFYERIQALDWLRGRMLSVRQTDGDVSPICGVSSGIMPDGTLDVGGVKVYAGEAHVEGIG